LLQHQKTVAEVVLRWHLQMGGSMIAKSSHPERIKENFKVSPSHNDRIRETLGRVLPVE
jgi:diketogulonate reductase-like aldo/keto reductase